MAVLCPTVRVTEPNVRPGHWQPPLRCFPGSGPAPAGLPVPSESKSAVPQGRLPAEASSVESLLKRDCMLGSRAILQEAISSRKHILPRALSARPRVTMTGCHTSHDVGHHELRVARSLARLPSRPSGSATRRRGGGPGGQGSAPNPANPVACWALTNWAAVGRCGQGGALRPRLTARRVQRGPGGRLSFQPLPRVLRTALLPPESPRRTPCQRAWSGDPGERVSPIQRKQKREKPYNAVTYA